MAVYKRLSYTLSNSLYNLLLVDYIELGQELERDDRLCIYYRVVLAYSVYSSLIARLFTKLNNYSE